MITENAYYVCILSPICHTVWEILLSTRTWFASQTSQSSPTVMRWALW